MKNLMFSTLIQEIRIIAATAGALVITTLSSFDEWLKITLLTVTIGYTLTKWTFSVIDRKTKNKKDNEE